MSNPIAKLVSNVFGKRGVAAGNVAPQDRPLKLRAYDREDFAVVSAVLQDALVPVIERVLAAHPEQVEAYRGGKTQLLGFFIGQVMRQTGGRADAQPVIDLAWLSGEKRFALVANRFRWERRAPAGDLPDQPAEEAASTETEGGRDSGQLPQEAEAPDARFEDAPLYERVHCGVTFDKVEQVAYRGFSKEASGHVLELLAVVADDQGITVTFAGEAALRLQGSQIVCHLEDVGEPWPTQWRPSHARADQDSQGGTGADPTSGEDAPQANRNGKHT